MENFYNYRYTKYYCENCYWNGLGDELEVVDIESGLLDFACPNCERTIALISLPTIKERFKYGSDKEKKEFQKLIDFFEEWKKYRLESPGQLPDIEGEALIFEVEERIYKKSTFLYIMHKGKEIYKEPLLPGYWNRYLDIGKILREEYGKRMKDLLPPADKSLLLGDYDAAQFIIQEFRDSLKE